jgi:hypothetical protein
VLPRTLVAQTILQPLPMDEYPNLVAFISEHAIKPGHDFGDEFEYGLEGAPSTGMIGGALETYDRLAAEIAKA